MTSISQEQLSKSQQVKVINVNPGIEKRLGKLRIVKSIHTKMLSEESHGNAGDDQSDFINGPLPNEPLEPI